MATTLETLHRLMSRPNIDDVGGRQALKLIGALIDAADDADDAVGLRHALNWATHLEKRRLSGREKAVLAFFAGNAWSTLRRLRTSGNHRAWELHPEEVVKEVRCYRSALRAVGPRGLPVRCRCEVLTNLGNTMSNLGRLVEALKYYDEALALDPTFVMARGNRGFCLSYYARILHVPSSRGAVMHKAYIDLKDALRRGSQLTPAARDGFARALHEVEIHVPSKVLAKRIKWPRFPKSIGPQECKYRRWCLEHRLFLNPVNDIGPVTAAAADDLGLPPIVTRIKEGPYLHGFFSQMKQEYVSARFLAYEANTASEPHFSDRWVAMCNTLDYPSYCLAVEKSKAAFRMAYSLFDKMAVFLDQYLRLKIKPKERIAFRTLWFKDRHQKERRGQFSKRENWPMRGLYWLSRDFAKEDAAKNDSMEPEALELARIRNRIEHGFLKVHDECWNGRNRKKGGRADVLAISICRQEFFAKTLKVLSLARAAMIYLVGAVYQEEKHRTVRRRPETFVGTMALDAWHDDWKR